MIESVSVIIPSALRKAPDGELWLTRALRSVAAQTFQPAEVIVGLDPNVDDEQVMDLFFDLFDHGDKLKTWCEHGKIKGHQSACNEAVKASTSTLIAILEDDDKYREKHLQYLYEAIQRHKVDFVSMSQQQVDFDGKDLGVFDFPTCSGWILRREVWDRIGGFDTSFIVHHDNRFLAELNRLKIRRIHLLEDTPNPPQRQQLQVLALFSWLVPIVGSDQVSVERMVHANSIMAGIATNEEKKARSTLEYNSLIAEYGHVAW